MRCLNCHQGGIREEQTTCPNCGVYLPSLLQHTLPPGTLLRNGTYRIDFALDTGGFGTIYRAVHTSLDCLVAIKEFYPRAYSMRGPGGVVYVPSPEHRNAFEAARRQFLLEGRILAGLKHRGIVDVLDLFEERNTAYLVMELLAGETLRRRLDAKPRGLSPDLVRKIVRQLVITLETLHRHSPTIYHLDIKPENVFLTSSERVILIDFGAARTGVHGYIVPQYDPLYAPPELLSSKSEVGPQSDLFELAMTTYELLTGHRPPPTQTRIYNREWNVADLKDPWRTVLEPALHLAKDKRPSSVLSWWVSKMGAGLPTFFREHIEIFLDPEEAQVLLEQRLAEQHVAYNELYQKKSSLQRTLHKMKEEEKGKKKLGKSEMAGEIDILKRQKERLENDLQNSIMQRQALTESLVKLREKYIELDKELRRFRGEI